MLRAIAQLLLELEDVGALGQAILNRLVVELRADSGALFVESPTESRRLIAQSGLNDQAMRHIRENVAQWTGQSSKDLSLRSRSEADPGGSIRSELGAVAGIRLQAGGSSIGSLILIRDSGDDFSDREMSLLETVSAMLALALDRASLNDNLQTRVADLELSDRQMEAYARDLRATFAAEKQRAEELARALAELEQTYLSTVRGLAVAVEAKDAYTAGHIVRVTRYGLLMMKLIAPDEANDPQYEYGFLLHDIGKLVVPDAVLGKNGPLTVEEWKIMRLHSETGRRILDGIPFLASAKEIVYAHHERWDGKGYPRGLKGEEIPLGAKVFPIADSFDAMTSDRPYRQAMPTEAALQEIRDGSGTQFWPEAVEAFLSIPFEVIESVRFGSMRWDGSLNG